MNRLLCFIFLFGISLFASAQTRALVFVNEKENRIIEVTKGQQLCLLYKGYMGQTEFVKNVVSEISDSTITLGIEYKSWREHKTGPIYKVIRISDIVAFRRTTISKQILKSTVQIGSVVGLYVLANQLYSSSEISNNNAFLLSIGAGIAVRTLINLIFPENVKYHMDEGWRVSSKTFSE